VKAFVLAISLVLAGCTSGEEANVVAESRLWERFDADLRAAVASGCYPERIRHLVSEYEVDRAQLAVATRDSRDGDTIFTFVITLVGVVVGFALFGRVGRG
jgi:hypothetical protein